jgi:hypothetical protein
MANTIGVIRSIAELFIPLFDIRKIEHANAPTSPNSSIKYTIGAAGFNRLIIATPNK